MPQDLFGTQIGVGGAWQIQGAVIRINGDDGPGLVVDAVRMVVTRTVAKFAPLNKQNRYLATGDPNCAMDLGVIIGPSTGLTQFIKQYSDPCKVTENVMVIMPTGLVLCDGNVLQAPSSVPKFICHGCLASGLSMNIQQGQGGITLINGGVSLMFIFLELQDVNQQQG